MIICFDAYRKPVREFSYGSNRSRVQSQHDIAPGDARIGSASMVGFDLLYRAQIVLESVHFADGSEWKPSKKYSAPKLQAMTDEHHDEQDDEVQPEISVWEDSVYGD